MSLDFIIYQRFFERQLHVTPLIYSIHLLHIHYDYCYSYENDVKLFFVITFLVLWQYYFILLFQVASFPKMKIFC